MKKQWVKNIITITTLTAALNIFAADCDNPSTSEQIAQCLGVELRDSDASINASYKELMAKLDEAAKLTLRTEQRAWIKERDAICSLDNKETDREKWYQALLLDYGKTVCVTRYTRGRTVALKGKLANIAGANTPAPAEGRPTPSSIDTQSTYDHRKPTVRASGKWYFEFTVDYAKAVAVEPTVLMVGISDRQLTLGILDNIRAKDASKETIHYGFALDLDNGKLYQSRNGEWANGEPGSNRGVDIKLGRDYYSVFQCTCDTIAPYLANRAFTPNFGGDKPMTYAIPAGYRPWRD